MAKMSDLSDLPPQPWKISDTLDSNSHAAQQLWEPGPPQMIHCPSSLNPPLGEDLPPPPSGPPFTKVQLSHCGQALGLSWLYD